MIHIDGRFEAAPARVLPAPLVAYRKTAMTMAVQMPEDFTVTTWEKQGENRDHGKAGDYLCVGSSGEAWINKRDNFEATYEAVEAVAE